MSADAPVRSLAARLAAAMARVGTVSKAGRRTDQGYSYVAWDDVAGSVQGAFAAEGIACIPSVVTAETEAAQTSQGKPTWRATVVVEYTLISADDPTDRLTFRWVGEADDAGDKAQQKALTYATKYGLMKLLLISGDDSDESGTKSEHDPGQAQAADAVPCPTCGKPLRQRQGSRGPFLSCSSRRSKDEPGCGQRPIDGTLEIYAAQLRAPVNGHVSDEQVGAALPARAGDGAAPSALDDLRTLIGQAALADVRDAFAAAGALPHFALIGGRPSLRADGIEPRQVEQITGALRAATRAD